MSKTNKLFTAGIFPCLEGCTNKVQGSMQEVKSDVWSCFPARVMRAVEAAMHGPEEFLVASKNPKVKLFGAAALE
jgi:hypothetical protein